MKKYLLTSLAPLGLLALTSCSSDIIKEDVSGLSSEERKYRGMGNALGDDTLVFGGKKKRSEDGVLGVNSHLWRASLDVVSFMPITQADPFGGVILTDWYTPPSTPHERFKVNIYILDRQLRSDGIKASVFRQVRHNHQWIDKPVSQAIMTDMENTILKHARSYKAAK